LDRTEHGLHGAAGGGWWLSRTMHVEVIMVLPQL
jgi:hypothetical protein